MQPVRPSSGWWLFPTVLLLLASAGLAACGSSSTTLLGPAVVKCAATPSVPTGPIAADGGTVTVPVTASPECPWTVSTEAAWISDLSPAAGQGNGTIQVRIAPNTAPVPRHADILLNDASIRVTQSGQSCRFDVTPSSAELGGSGGSVTIRVDTSAGCDWTVGTPDPWLTREGAATRTGPGLAEFDAGANPGPPRTATVAVAGQNVIISQGAISPVPTACTYVIAPRSYAAPATGAASSTMISAPAGCEWAAASQVPWLNITGSNSGAGAGQLSFVVDANAGAMRSGAIVVAGQTFQVTQAAATVQPTPCTFSVSPTGATLEAAGGTGPAISVTAASGCAWTASTTTTWLAVTSGASGSGNGTVSFTAAANTGAARSGTIVVAGQTFAVTQAAAMVEPTPCTFSVTPTEASLGAAGGAGPVISVTTASGCAWTASTTTTWLTVTSGASGSGNGAVSFTATANAGAARSGTIVVAGQTLAVTQAAGTIEPTPCTYLITPTDATLDAAGGTGPVISVTAAEGCAWTASTTATWLTVTSGANGSGSGTVSFTAAANTGTSRTTTLTVAGVDVTVSQESGCVFTVSPTSFTLDKAEAAGLTIAVNSGTGCQWTAVANVDWIVITAGATGAGVGSVEFSVAQNRGPSRTGTMTVAGTTVTVVQQ